LVIDEIILGILVIQSIISIAVVVVAITIKLDLAIIPIIIKNSRIGVIKN
jgi:hypothetical protein